MAKKDLQKQNLDKTSETKPVANKGKKRNAIITYSLIAVTAIGLGVTTGVIVKRTTSQVVTDYGEFNPENFQADSKELLRRYNMNANASFTPSELVNIGLEKYRQEKYSYSIGVGAANTILKQEIRNAQIRNDNEYFEESISTSSMVKLANRSRQNLEKDGIDHYVGKAVSAEVGEYPDNPNKYTNDEYKAKLGRTLDRMFIYIISDDSVIKDNCTTTKRSDGYTEVFLDLHPDISTYFYKIQMKEISNLDNMPTFTSLKHTYIFDKDMNLKYLRVNEVYKATMGMTVEINNLIDYYYHPGEKLEIPNNNQPINYSIEGEYDYGKN